MNISGTQEIRKLVKLFLGSCFPQQYFGGVSQLVPDGPEIVKHRPKQ